MFLYDVCYFACKDTKLLECARFWGFKDSREREMILAGLRAGQAVLPFRQRDGFRRYFRKPLALRL
jgi:hypothetical protein